MNKKCIYEIWDNIKWPNVCLCEIPEGESRKNMA